MTSTEEQRRWRASWLFGWCDGLRGRIAAALLLALFFQSIGSDLIFERIEAQRIERGRAQRLADWLSFADEFAATREDAVARMTGLWEPDLVVEFKEAAPSHRAGPSTTEDARTEALVRQARPQMDMLDFRAVRYGDDLSGSIRLTEGGWLVFYAKDHFASPSQLGRYIASAALLLICVILIALLFGRMIARPLVRLADAAERVGKDENVQVVVEGPREVRQLGAALSRMQDRLLLQVRNQLQSMAAISHDLRTPLARMRLHISSVEQVDVRHVLERDIDEIETFVASILEYLRGEDIEALQPTDVASVVMTVVDEAIDRGESVDYKGPHRLEVITRPMKLKRLIRNIVQNAVKHAGNAHVCLVSDATMIVITVIDDGPGIPPEELDTVFEAFRRIETSRNRATGGSGLGLTISRRLIGRLGGDILIANRPEGGLKVVIRLPRQLEKG